MEDSHDIPRHIAIIMDGNGRWANARGLPRVEGHRAGAKSVKVGSRNMPAAWCRIPHPLRLFF